MNMQTKICSKCSKELPATNEYFQPRKVSKDGLYSYCKDCLKIEHKKYRENNKEKIAMKSKQFRIDNKEKTAEYSKIYRLKNLESCSKQGKQWYEANKDKMIEYRKINKDKISSQRKQWREDNKDMISAKAKQYREINKKSIREQKKQFSKENKDKIAQYKKEYYKENRTKVIESASQYAKQNPDKIRIVQERRRSKKKQLLSTLTVEQWNDIKIEFNNRCAYCGEKVHLQQEHFIPLSKGGEYTVNNIIPACKRCNPSKNNGDFFEWYPKQEYYSKEREQFILNHLGYNEDKQQLKVI